LPQEGQHFCYCLADYLSTSLEGFLDLVITFRKGNTNEGRNWSGFVGGGENRKCIAFLTRKVNVGNVCKQITLSTMKVKEKVNF